MGVSAEKASDPASPLNNDTNINDITESVITFLPAPHTLFIASI
jgi:hypothetical protein